MYVSEKGAETKWCPMSRVFDTGNAGGRGVAAVNREERNASCIASKCMMWRFVEPDSPTDTYYGFCGLAGKPIYELSKD